MTGKWHLGRDDLRHTPEGRGFDEFYGKYEGGGDFWNHAGDPLADGIMLWTRATPAAGTAAAPKGALAAPAHALAAPLGTSAESPRVGGT